MAEMEVILSEFQGSYRLSILESLEIIPAITWLCLNGHDLKIPPMSQPILLSEGLHWQMPYVFKKLVMLGVPKQRIPDLAHRVEGTFFNLGFSQGCQAEWSLHWGQVMGQPEDFQFDIDALREKAIVDVSECYND